MIKSFQHRGLEQFFLTGSKAGIQPKHANRLKDQLTILNEAAKPSDMGRSGWESHPLRGNLQGHWSVTINGNWRLTFKFERRDAVLADYKDYR